MIFLLNQRQRERDRAFDSKVELVTITTYSPTGTHEKIFNNLKKICS